MFSKNLALFQNRFPELYTLLQSSIQQFSSDKAHGVNWEIVKAKNGSITAKENGIFLHSSYNPQREAEQMVSKTEEGKDGVGVFLSFGLGYGLDAFCKKYPERPLIIIERDIAYLLTAFEYFDWSCIFSHKNVIIATGATESEIVALLEHFGIEQCQIFSNAAQSSHAKPFYDAITALIKRNIQKAKINKKTMEKFGSLWLRNATRNLKTFARCDGIAQYKNAAIMENGETLPSVVLAAGPSLADILPHLKELKKRGIIICVDTALRACLKAGVEPDFIVLVDPQYWAYKHIAGLASPSSILITESAVFPPALRFHCKKIIMSSSLFPLGSYFEGKFRKKGAIGAGGSVATSAWDFARQIGSTHIFLAGLDLGFSSKNTHVKGSSAEERAHIASTRLNSAEKMSVSSLYSANPFKEKDYLGRDILTDDKMKMFAWWFESNVIKALEKGQRTYTFCAQNMAIPNISVACINDFLARKEIESKKEVFFRTADESQSCAFDTEKFAAELKDFSRKVKTLLSRPNALREDKRLYEVAKALFPSKEYFEHFFTPASHTAMPEEFITELNKNATLFLNSLFSVQ